MKKQKSKKVYIVVRRLSTHEEVKRIDVTNRSEREREKIENGMLRQLDAENFRVGQETEPA